MKRSEGVKREGLGLFYTLTSTYIDGGGVGGEVYVTWERWRHGFGRARCSVAPEGRETSGVDGWNVCHMKMLWIEFSL